MPTSTLTHNHRALREWLLDLVAEEPELRRDAGEALAAMHYGVESMYTFSKSVPDSEAPERFAIAVRETAAEATFPREEWVGHLLTYLREIRDDWQSVVEAELEAEPDDEADFMVPHRAAFNAANTHTERNAVVMRLANEILGFSETDRLAIDHEVFAYSFRMAMVVFEALDSVLMANEDALREMLAWTDGAVDALRALARIGPEAVGFVPDLMERLDRPEHAARSHTAAALAAIAIGDVQVTHALLDRLHAADPHIRFGAASTLGYMGREANESVPRVTEGLLKATEDADTDTRVEAVWALGEAGARSDDVVERLLHLLDDPNDWVQAMAITGLGKLVMRPEETILRLVDAFDHFAEPNADEGDYTRLCRALSHFPPELVAPAAVPVLAKHLCDEQDELVHREVIRLLGDLGHLAAPVLPELEALQAWLETLLENQQQEDDDWDEEDDDAEDAADDAEDDSDWEDADDWDGEDDDDIDWVDDDDPDAWEDDDDAEDLRMTDIRAAIAAIRPNP